MGENQGIEQVLGKLVELLAANRNEAQSSSKEIVVHTERVQKIELMPNDVKLEGIKNYLAWSRRALWLLKAKNLEGFVNGESSKPADKLSSEWSKWDATNFPISQNPKICVFERFQQKVCGKASLYVSLAHSP